LENLEQYISEQNKTTKILKKQLHNLNSKYTDALDKIQLLELSSFELNKENQYLKKINNQVTNIIIIVKYLF